MTEFNRNQSAAVDAAKVAAALADLDDDQLLQRLRLLLPAERDLVIDQLVKLGIEVSR